jgi:hypothetical protein
VYWIPIFEILEARELEACLVNARHIKNVPGRKSDVQDCQWLQQLHSFGLLRGSFRPEAELVALRAYLRQRAMLIEHRAAHTQHMQKALLQMNLRLTQVLSDITGVTGLAIIRAIVAGERNPRKLAQLRDPHCRHSEPEIVKALTGSYRVEHLFALQQALALYEAYTTQLAECDRQLEQHYATLKPRFDPDDPDQPLGPDPKPNTHSKNAPDYDVRRELFELVGVDLTVIPGLKTSAPGWGSPHITILPAARSSARARSPPTTAPARSCAWRLSRSDAAGVDWPPTTARKKHAWAPPPPSLPPLTNWRASSITCSKTANLTNRSPRRPSPSSAASASCVICKSAPPSSVYAYRRSRPVSF